MLKPAKKKLLTAKEKVDFKLEFHATRVPQRGWDKLLVSLISLETNKVTAKTGKVSVKNGVCQWSEPVYESPMLFHESGREGTNKALYKLVVSMGLSRFGILGEATVNLADYMQAVVPISSPLQLQNCNSGSILHVKIQRIGPKAASRELENNQKEIFWERDCHPANFDVSQRSYDQKSAGSALTAEKNDSASTSCLSSDSIEVPQTPDVTESRPYDREGMGEELASPSSSIGSCSGRQELGNVFHDYARFSRMDIVNQCLVNEYTSLGENAALIFSPFHPSKSIEGSDNSNSQFELGALSPWANDKRKELEAAEATIKDLMSEAVSMEQRFKQMELQTEVLKRQLEAETTRSEELQKALATLGEERDNMKLEMHNLQFSGKLQEKAGDGFSWRELHDELEYEKSVNLNLSLQLQKTQESNSELLLEIQDLERLLNGKDGQEVQSTRALDSQNILQWENTEIISRKTVDSLKKELEELERDSQELTEENMELISQLKQANDKRKINESTVMQLELKTKSESYFFAEVETEKLRKEVDEMTVKLRDCQDSYENKLATSRTLIDDLNSSVMMVRTKNIRLERELQSSEEHISDLLKEIESLKLEIDGHEKERRLFASQKGQLKGLREKASKVEQEHKGSLKRVEDLEAMNRELKGEKSRDLTAIKMQLQDFQEHALATDSKYRDALQGMAHLREEKLNLDKELSNLLETKEAAEATVAQLQSFNMVLQEKLHLEQVKNSELVHQCHEKEANSSQLCEQLKVNETQVKVLEQAVKELEALGKEMEGKASSLQEENMLCRCKIKELELQIVSLEKDTVAMQASSSASKAKLQNLQVVNEELSEKLKNAQEELDWARENTNTLVNEIRELEGEIESTMVVQNCLKESVSQLEFQKQGLRSQLEELLNKKMQLEKEVIVLEERCKNVSNEKDAFVVAMQEQKTVQENAVSSLHSVIEEQEDKIKLILASSGENRVQQALLDASKVREEKAKLEEKVKQLQVMLNQVKKDASDGENKVEHALLEASMLNGEKAELEENMLKLEEMLKQAEKDAFSLKQNLDFQFQEARVKELGMMKRLDKATMEAQLLQDEKSNYLQKVMGLEAQCAAAELEKKKMSAAMSKIERELEVLQREREDRERAFANLKEEKEKLKGSIGKVEREMATSMERAKSYDKALGFFEQSKASMEETILCLQDTVAIDDNIELNKGCELGLKLSEEDVERDELKEKVLSLEEEHQYKVTACAVLEKQLKDNSGGDSVSLLARSLSGANSRVGPLSAIPPTRDAKESADLREKVKVLEGELKMKVAELESSKQQLKEQHGQLLLKMEQSEQANIKLAKEQSNTNMNQLVKELNSLKNQNATLCQREIELLSKISSQESLQSELENLKEEKRVLELALSNFNASVNGENFSKRIASLEMELAEILEANNMYKKELQSAFAKQHNVHTAALENLGSVEQVIQDLADLKRKNRMLEDELKDMRERYFNMSLRFAEVEAEREELVMSIRSLRGAKKLTPYRSANF